MMSSSSTEATINFFLNFVKTRSSEISPTIIMSDCDKAQTNAIKAVYLESQLLLCWWHVLRAIRTHFNTKEFPGQWSLIQDWVRTTDDKEFEVCWKYIEEDTSVPKSLAQYIAQDWLPYKEMWSTTSRQNHTIFEKGNTNMLLEAYVTPIFTFISN